METYSYKNICSGEFAEKVHQLLWLYDFDPKDPFVGGLFTEVWQRDSGIEISARRSTKSQEITHTFVQKSGGETELILTSWDKPGANPFLKNLGSFGAGMRAGARRTTIVLVDEDKTVR